MCLFSFRADVRTAASAKIRHLLSQSRSATDLFHSKGPFRLSKFYFSTDKPLSTRDVRGALTTGFDLPKLMSVAFGAYDSSIRAIAMRQIRVGLREQSPLISVDEILLKSMTAGCLNVLSDMSGPNSTDATMLELQLEAASLMEDLVFFEKRTLASIGVGIGYLDLTPLLLVILQSNNADTYSYIGGRISKDALLLKVFRIINIWSLSDEVWEYSASESKPPSSIIPDFFREHFGIVELSPGHLALVDEAYRNYTRPAVIIQSESSPNTTAKTSLGKLLGFVFGNYAKCRPNMPLNL